MANMTELDSKYIDLDDDRYIVFKVNGLDSRDVVYLRRLLAKPAQSGLMKPLEPWGWAYQENPGGEWQITRRNPRMAWPAGQPDYDEVVPLYDLGDGKIVSSRT